VSDLQVLDMTEQVRCVRSAPGQRTSVESETTDEIAYHRLETLRRVMI